MGHSFKLIRPFSGCSTSNGSFVDLWAVARANVTGGYGRISLASIDDQEGRGVSLSRSSRWGCFETPYLESGHARQTGMSDSCPECALHDPDPHDDGPGHCFEGVCEDYQALPQLLLGGS